MAVTNFKTAFRGVGHNRVQCIECGTTFRERIATINIEDWRYCPYCRREIDWSVHFPKPRIPMPKYDALTDSTE